MFRLCLLSLLFGAAAFGADGQLDRATLKGIKAVNIVIDPIDPSLGLDADLLRATIQAKLDRAGIAVDKSANEFLGLRVTGAQGRRMPVALCLSLGLYQAVLLSRDRNVRTATETWSVDSVASAQSKAVKDAAADLLGDLVDRFVRAYRSVNTR